MCACGSDRESGDLGMNVERKWKIFAPCSSLLRYDQIQSGPRFDRGTWQIKQKFEFEFEYPFSYFITTPDIFNEPYSIYYKQIC